MLSEISQSQKENYRMIPLTCDSQNTSYSETQKTEWFFQKQEEKWSGSYCLIGYRASVSKGEKRYGDGQW